MFTQLRMRKMVISIIVENNFSKVETFNESAIKGTGSLVACSAYSGLAPYPGRIDFQITKVFNGSRGLTDEIL